MEDACTSPKIEEGTKRVIICEGAHDKSFLSALIKGRGLPDFKILDAYKCCGKGGKDGLAPALEGLRVLSGFQELKGVGIVTDNDNNKSLSKLQNNLESLDYYESTQSPRVGKMEGIPVITILIPNHTNHGNLETFCLPALIEKWPDAKKCVDAYLRCTQAAKWQIHKLAKSQVRCIISGFYKRKPERGLGHLFEAEKSLVDHPCFNELTSILSRFDEIVEKASF